MASSNSQRALVIGVSQYPDPITDLPGVAADVKEMAKLLSSKHSSFPSVGVTVLTDKQANRNSVSSALQQTFTNVTKDDTVFVYLAGHGDVIGNDYFFMAHDSDGNQLQQTGVSLKEIKSLFDQAKSRRVFLWLDFCHSGGILARGMSDDMSAIRRAIGVVSGHGKIIVAACTSSQYAYEDPSVGHGLFTHALLRGLKGEAKSAQGEVTALSLYEFIDHQVTNQKQQPVFFGEMTGRIVLMHYPDQKKTPKGTKKPQPKTKKVAKPTADWVMLGENFFRASSVRHRSEGIIELEISPASTEEEAALSSLRPSRYAGASELSFACNNDAHSVRTEQAESEMRSGRQIWNLTLKVSDEPFARGGGLEATYNTGGKTYTPDDIAKLRVGRVLLNDPPPMTTSRDRAYGPESMVEGMIKGLGRYSVKECIIQRCYLSHSVNWKECARLQSVFLLKATGTVEHILELTIGPVRGGRVSVTFRGRRPQQYSNVVPETIEVKGSCSVS